MSLTIRRGEPLPCLSELVPGHMTWRLEELQMEVRAGTTSLYVDLVDNALLRGKTVMRYKIWSVESKRGGVLQEIQARLADPSLKGLRAVLDETERRFPLKEGTTFEVWGDDDLRISREEVPAVRFHSPLWESRLQKVTALPAPGKCFSARDVARLLVNGQYEVMKCKGIYTDDYARDAENNYGIGNVPNPKTFVPSLVADPKNWSIGGIGPDGGMLMIFIHSERYYLKPKL